MCMVLMVLDGGGDSGVPEGGSGGPGGHWASSGTHPSGPYSAVVDPKDPQSY